MPLTLPMPPNFQRHSSTGGAAGYSAASIAQANPGLVSLGPGKPGQTLGNAPGSLRSSLSTLSSKDSDLDSSNSQRVLQLEQSLQIKQAEMATVQKKLNRAEGQCKRLKEKAQKVRASSQPRSTS